MCDVPVHLRDHIYYTRRISTHQTRPVSCRQDQYDVSFHLSDHTYCKRGISNHQTERAVKSGASRGRTSCRKDQRPQKRKRSSEPRPPPPPSAGPPVETVWPSRPRPATISPEDLPVASPVPPNPPPSRPDDQLVSSTEDPDGPLMIHNRSVEEYQRLYHEVVDPLLRNKSGRVLRYRLGLGRLIKQKLWERLNHRPVTKG